jgi:transposase
VLKSDIQIGPVYHRLPKRIRAHATICFIALLMQRVMRQRLKAKGSSCSPQHALRLLERIRQHRIRLNGQATNGISAIEREQLKLFSELVRPGSLGQPNTTTSSGVRDRRSRDPGAPANPG